MTWRRGRGSRCRRRRARRTRGFAPARCRGNSRAVRRLRWS